MNCIAQQVKGLQHIGLPTNDMEQTLAFYQSLGFTLAHEANNQGERVCFLKLGGVCIEAYENGQATLRAGAPVPALLGKGRPVLQHPRPQWGNGGIQPVCIKTACHNSPVARKKIGLQTCSPIFLNWITS